MESNDIHSFSADRPIRKSEDDILGRSNFSFNLAEAIASWHGNDSLVIALHGDWGSGKSSIKNLAVEALESFTEGKPDIIEFSPWEWAAQEKITTAFFEEISKSIGHSGSDEASQELAATLKKYGRYLATGETIISGFSQALPALFVFTLSFGLAGTLSNSAWIENLSATVLIAASTIAVALKWGGGLLDRLAENTKATQEESKKSLSRLRSDLSEKLSKRKSGLVIVMDDLDRLTSKQLRMVFQLIKANLQFPNFVFLLLFQRDLVEEKLTDGRQSGRDYLEKIIQVPFDIPKIEPTKLFDLLFSRLDKIIEQNSSASKMFDQGRWGNIFHGALYSYFGNLRNIYRFTSTFSFHFSLLKGRSVFEVNPVDLIAIECIRVFEPDVYKEISRSKDVLTNSLSDTSERNIESAKAVLESILNKSSPALRESNGELIRQLFPATHAILSNVSYSSGHADLWLREMRICHPSNFDKYFQFSIPNGELSNSDLQDMLSLTSDSSKLVPFVEALKERNILKNALAQFEAYTDEIPLNNGYEYIKCLLDIGDGVDHESAGFATFSSNTHVMRLAYWFLKRLSVNDRGALLISAFNDSNGLSIVESLLQADENRREKSDPELLLSDESFLKLKNEFVQKLDFFAENDPNSLIQNEHFVSFLYRWKRWGDEKKIISWLEEQIKNTENCISLLEGFVGKSSSFGMGDYVAKTTSHMKLGNIEMFLAIHLIEERLEGLNEQALTPSAQEAVQLFRKAVANRNEGVPEVDD